MFDLSPAAAEMKRLVDGVRDDQLGHPTPCTDWSVGDLLAHVHQFASVFTTNAHKQSPRPPTTLVEDWRRAIPAQLDELAAAWSDEAAWSGRTSAGGIEMAAADNAAVAVEELTVHGWDLARATGQQLFVDDGTLDAVDRFFEAFDEAPFEPVEAPHDATRLERLIADTGRHPR